MKLSEKIYYCRRKAGKSQEALAEQLGVSRQAVSKWETGEAEPEISKLKRLAEVFDVSVDWLLSDEEPHEEYSSYSYEEPHEKHYPDWVDSLPGTLGKLIRRYGWLVGIYIALSGVGVILVGGLARVMTRKMFSGFNSFTDGMYGTAGGLVTDFIANNPVSAMGTVIMVIGIMIAIAGIVIALLLKKYSGDK